MKYKDEDLIRCLKKFVCGKPIEFDDISYVDLYDNKKPGELFQELLCSEEKTGNDHVNYFFTKLKKNFGDIKWKERDTSKEIMDKEGSVIGLKKTFYFDEERSGKDSNKIMYWIMKEYCLDEAIVKELREGGEIKHEDYVVCSIMKKVSLCKNSRYFPTKMENIASDYHCGPDEKSLYAAEIWKLPALDGPFESMTDEDLTIFDKPDPEYPQAYENKKLE